MINNYGIEEFEETRRRFDRYESEYLSHEGTMVIRGSSGIEELKMTDLSLGIETVLVALKI